MLEENFLLQVMNLGISYDRKIGLIKDELGGKMFH